MTGDRADWDALRDWAHATAGVALGPDRIAALAAYVETLRLWNRKLALVSHRDADLLIRKHVADSVFVAARCSGSDRLADLGSGAGFPGLVIAILWPEAPVTLIEARGKKASFLEAAARSAGARNARVCNARIEAVADTDEHRGHYTVATARALTSAAELLQLARPLLAPGGRVLAMRSVHEDIAGTAPVAEDIRYLLPDGTPRRLLVFHPAVPHPEP